MSGPPLRIRLIGRAMTEAVARAPFAWRVVRRPMTRFFGDAAATWDERLQPDDDDHLAPLLAALDELALSARRILDGASHGPRTPFFTSHAALRGGFGRSGLEVIGSGRAGDEGTWLAARSSRGR